ncbi:MAG: hypothetical protein RJA70_3101 [Pseudomonadota bacterium]|jgi:phosphohistidine phosphatase
MKTLVLMRHGDASENPAGDFERQLSDRGREQCRETAVQLLGEGLQFTAVISSSGVRALQSAQIVCDIMDLACLPEARASLYLAEASLYLEAVRSAPDEISTLLLVAHNPGLSELAVQLQRGGTSLGTAEHVVFRRKIERWSEFSA